MEPWRRAVDLGELGNKLGLAEGGEMQLGQGNMLRHLLKGKEQLPCRGEPEAVLVEASRERPVPRPGPAWQQAVIVSPDL